MRSRLSEWNVLVVLATKRVESHINREGLLANYLCKVYKAVIITCQEGPKDGLFKNKSCDNSYTHCPQMVGTGYEASLQEVLVNLVESYTKKEVNGPS